MTLKDQANFEQAAAALKDMVPMLIGILPDLAKLYMQYYKALLKAGFSAEQAIQLIAAHGTSLGIKGQQG